jgi:hypothetical protein
MNLRQFETEHDEVLNVVSKAAEAERSASRGQGSAACRSAGRNMADQEGIVRIYERAVLAVALATVASLIVAIAMAFFGSRSGAIAGAIGTVVTGAAMGFVLKQRNDARKRLDVLRRLRDKYC